jgi:hypothetical protein
MYESVQVVEKAADRVAVLIPPFHSFAGAVAGLVGIESGVVSGLINPNDSALKRRWRPRHGKDYHEACSRAFRT